jgi:hypothetical protein
MESSNLQKLSGVRHGLAISTSIGTSCEQKQEKIRGEGIGEEESCSSSSDSSSQFNFNESNKQMANGFSSFKMSEGKFSLDIGN